MKTKKEISNAITKLALKTAFKSAGSACLWWQYQPKTPKALKSKSKLHSD